MVSDELNPLWWANFVAEAGLGGGGGQWREFLETSILGVLF
jgi:hypothetical protein